MGISSQITTNTLLSYIPLTLKACPRPAQEIYRLVLTISFASMLYLMLVQVLGFLDFHTDFSWLDSHMVVSQYAAFESINARFLGKHHFMFSHLEPRESKLLKFLLERREHEKYA